MIRWISGAAAHAAPSELSIINDEVASATQMLKDIGIVK